MKIRLLLIAISLLFCTPHDAISAPNMCNLLYFRELGLILEASKLCKIDFLHFKKSQYIDSMTKDCDEVGAAYKIDSELKGKEIFENVMRSGGLEGSCNFISKILKINENDNTNSVIQSINKSLASEDLSLVKNANDENDSIWKEIYDYGWKQMPDNYWRGENNEWRERDKFKNLKVNLDVNNDGIRDVAQLFLRNGRIGLFASVSFGKSHKLFKLDETENYEGLGIASVEPGKYPTACGKGYWKCKSKEPSVIYLKTQAISFFQYESSERFFYFNKKTGNFAHIWISD